VGAVIGASVAGVLTNYRRAPGQIHEDYPPEKIARCHPSSQGLFWFCSLAAAVLAFSIFMLMLWRDGEDDLPLALILFALFGPLCLLGGSLMMAISLACRSDLRRHAGYWKALGWITLGTLIGTFSGIGVMFLIAAAM
jgi:hypothetical protein